MDNDDRQVGRILSRREVLKLLGATGAVMLVGCGPSQSGSGATTQAPTAGAGATTAPAEGATVEIWHCDAAGQYSDVSDPGFNTKGQNWLRGAQVTDANGKATFTTIYPGWYRGRAVHIHFKVHPDATKVFTSQLFFDDA